MAADTSAQVEEVVRIAHQMIGGTVDLVDGCRMINDLRWDLDSDGLDDRFEKFVEFERKCSRFPPKESRHLWSPSYLAQLDDDADRLIEECGSDLLRECRTLLRSYGRESG